MRAYGAAELEQSISQFFLVSQGDDSSATVFHRELCSSFQKRATAELRPPCPNCDCLKQVAQLLPWLVRVSGHDALPPLPITLAPRLQVRGDEILFGSKTAIQAHFGDAGFLDDGVDADCVDAFAIKEVVGSFQNAFAGRLVR